MSLNAMVQDLFDQEGRARRCAHEWAAVDFYMHFCAHRETNDNVHLDWIRSQIRACPYDAVVGNGYAPILDQFYETCGPDVVLIHLKRKHRSDFINSFIQNIELFPQNHKYYSDSHSAIGKRMAAFHFDGCSYRAWEKWSLQDKVAWYYDKTHDLIESKKHLFGTSITIETESLDDLQTRRDIADVIGVDSVPKAARINRQIALDGLDDEERRWVHIYLMTLDAERLARDDAYGVSHFLDTFLNRQGQGLLSPEEIVRQSALEQLDRVRALLANSILEIDKLRLPAVPGHDTAGPS